MKLLFGKWNFQNKLPLQMPEFVGSGNETKAWKVDKKSLSVKPESLTFTYKSTA